MEVKATVTKDDKEINRLKKIVKTKRLVFKSTIEKRKFYLYVATAIRNMAYYYAPKDTGFMANNIKIIDSPEGIGVASFAPYSIYVHEIMENRHAEPTRAKFLEDAALEIENMLGGVVTISIRYFPVLMVLINSSAGAPISQLKIDNTIKINELSRELEAYRLSKVGDTFE